MVRHFTTGIGYPVAYLFTQDQAAQISRESLGFLRRNGLVNLTKVTIDCSLVEVAALRAAFPNSSIQWCVFRDVRAWWTSNQQKASRRNTQDSTVIQEHLLLSLKNIMWEPHLEDVHRKLVGLRFELVEFTYFLGYFERTWVHHQPISTRLPVDKEFEGD